MVEIARVLDEAAEQVGGDRRVGDRRQVQPARRVESVVEILEVGDGAAFRGEVPLHHALAMQVQNPALREAAAERLSDLRRVCSAPLREQERFRHGADRHADDDLVGELGELAGPVRPDEDGPAHDAQQASTRAKISGSPPAMIARVPCSAPTVPPETGASM